jgi:hypothetical protein
MDGSRPQVELNTCFFNLNLGGIQLCIPLFYGSQALLICRNFLIVILLFH